MQTILRALAPVLVIVAGCFHPQTQPDKPAPPQTARKPAAVTEADVTEFNAHQLWQAAVAECKDAQRDGTADGEGAARKPSK